MGNYVTYETNIHFNSDSEERGIDKAKNALGKHFTADEYLDPLFELLALGYTSTKWWTDFNRHMKVASKVLNKPIIVFDNDEDGWYDNIEVFHPEGWCYGCNRRQFINGMIKMFNLDPFEFVCISNFDLQDYILNNGFDKAVEYAQYKSGVSYEWG